MDIRAEQWELVEPINYRLALGEIWQARWWIGLCIVVCASILTATALLITPVYRATTLLVPASAERNSLGNALNSAIGSLGAVASLANLGASPVDSTTEEALAVLRSRHFTDSFINDNQLMPVLFARKWDESNHRWKVAVRDQPTPWRAYKYFNTKIRSISQDRKTGLVTLQIDWTDRVEAARWTNELVQRLNAEMRNRAIANADASLGFLEAELASTATVETRAAINRLIEAQVKQRMLANVTQEYAFRVVDKAMVPDADNPASPPKLLLIAAGPLLGLALGVASVLLYRNYLKDRRMSARP